jgi:hypothetical protein
MSSDLGRFRVHYRRLWVPAICFRFMHRRSRRALFPAYTRG